jgi:hypothetical protein
MLWHWKFGCAVLSFPGCYKTDLNRAWIEAYLLRWRAPPFALSFRMRIDDCRAAGRFEIVAVFMPQTWTSSWLSGSSSLAKDRLFFAMALEAAANWILADDSLGPHCHHAFHAGSVMLRKCADMIVRSRIAWRVERNAVRFSRSQYLRLGQHVERLLECDVIGFRGGIPASTNFGASVCLASKTQLCATASLGNSPIFFSLTVTLCPGFASKLVTLNFMKSSPVISTTFGGATLREQPRNAEANASRAIFVTFIRSPIIAGMSDMRQRC